MRGNRTAARMALQKVALANFHVDCIPSTFDILFVSDLQSK